MTLLFTYDVVLLVDDLQHWKGSKLSVRWLELFSARKCWVAHYCSGGLKQVSWDLKKMEREMDRRFGALIKVLFWMSSFQFTGLSMF